jgi:hypothetical protein
MPQKEIGLHLIEDTKVLCKNGKVMIPTSLWHRAISWYHHYLQHPGHSRLEETMRSVMYWKGVRTTIQRHVKSCRSCQVNKRHSKKYGHLPPKLVMMIPWKALCEDLLGPYTLKGKCGSSIDFICLTMINPTTSWFEILELPTVAQETTVPPPLPPPLPTPLPLPLPPITVTALATAFAIALATPATPATTATTTMTITANATANATATATTTRPCH